MRNKYREDIVSMLKKTAAAEYKHERPHSKYALVSKDVANLLAKLKVYGIETDIIDFIVDANEIQEQTQIPDTSLRITMAIKRFSVNE